MRWFSVCTVLGAVLLPAANAGPCRISSSTTSLSTPTETPTSTSSSSSTTETPIVTPTETPTTPIETPSTPIETPTTPIQTPTTPTPTPEPTLENFIDNGNFEDDDLAVWAQRTVVIRKDRSKSASPDHYAQYVVDDTFASGGNQLNQTLNGLNTSRLYRLSFKLAVFGTPNLGTATCEMQALFGGDVFKSWPINTSVLGQYSTYSYSGFSFPYQDGTFTLRLRCTDQKKVTIEVGVDDIVLNKVVQQKL
ncbi:hypothetical protein B0T10DRAFT_601046 [Thelonectria olida]|uniref:CBM-cenC domain-containing protein n=1 Tax=Thelonectria olida TaxID=1576542 RepID=A0A9P8WJJ1_9HYPO|nr:hypothetical protein B0T10DRAFT_601046 [Thelonectria olida]